MRIKVRNGAAFSNYCPHPVGTYLHCTFDPNAEWVGTTWVKQAQGNYLVSAGSTYVSGGSYGSNTHTLTVGEMPSHRHRPNVQYRTVSAPTGNDVDGLCSPGYGYDADYYEATGGGMPHNNMPQSIAAPLWVRTK